MHENFKKYLNEIGEIPKNVELDFENDKILWRYLAPAYINKDSKGETYNSYGSFGGEVLVNGEVIGYFKINKMSNRTPEEEAENWFYHKYIRIDKPLIRRIWGVTHYIWGSTY